MRMFRQPAAAQPAVEQPKMPEQVRMPSATDPDVRAASAMKVQEDMRKRQGRDSTRLAPASGEAPVYSRTALG